MAYSDNLMSNSVGESPVLLEMYNPTKESVLVELFECSGEVEFEATSDYKKFVDKKTSIAEHSKTSGHYVVRLDNADVPYSMLFSRVTVKNTRYNTDATFLSVTASSSPNSTRTLRWGRTPPRSPTNSLMIKSSSQSATSGLTASTTWLAISTCCSLRANPPNSSRQCNAAPKSRTIQLLTFRRTKRRASRTLRSRLTESKLCTL
ncbi:unnamed protein product [Sphagnum balticum]